MTQVQAPSHLHYTAEHEWVAVQADANRPGTVRIGITDFAQDALGDVVYVNLGEVGTVVAVGEPLGEVESTKSVSDIYAPIQGVIVARNPALESEPELINRDPYGEGWLIELSVEDLSGVDTALLDAAEYGKLIGN